MTSMSLREQLREKLGTEPLAPNPCFTTSDQGIGLLVEISSGAVWILPWHQFMAGYYDPREPERLVLTFVAHEVTIFGFNLGRIVPHLMNQRVERMRAVPEKYLSVAGGDLSIAQICVRSLAEPVVPE